MPPVRAAHLALAAVVVVWAGAFAAIKALLDAGVDGVDIALGRFVLAAPGFAFVLWRAGGLPGLTRRDAVRVAAGGLLVVAVYHVSLNVGEQWTTSGTAALIVATAPAMTLGLSIAAGLEVFTPARLVGLAVAFAGVVVVVVLASGQTVSADAVKGPLVIMAAPASFALYNILLKPLFGRYGTLAVTAATTLAGTVLLLPLVRPASVDRSLEAMGAGDWALMLYLGVLCTFLAYLGWSVGLDALDPSQAVTFLYGVPGLAVVIGAIVLDEPLTGWLVVGGALIVGGVVIAQRSRGRTPMPRPAGEAA